MLPSYSKRTSVLQVRMSAEEMLSFMSASQACSASLSAWTRHAMQEQRDREAEERR